MAEKRAGEAVAPGARQRERAELRALSRRLVEAQESERRAIANELHDVLGQSMTVLKLILDRAIHVPPDAVMAVLEEAEAVVDEVVARVRDLSLELMPSMLDDLGLLPTLLWYCERHSEKTKMHVDFKHAGLDRQLPAPVATAAYRIVQEAVTNATQHSRATEVMVRAWADDRSLFLHIEDHGTGFTPESIPVGSDCGIAGMRQRALSLGGKLSLESTPGAGTIVSAELPLSGPAQKRKVRPNDQHSSGG